MKQNSKRNKYRILGNNLSTEKKNISNSKWNEKLITGYFNQTIF